MSLAPEQPSPTTSGTTNRTNPGGRPRDWKPPRTRRLTRLYSYTSLSVPDILKVIEEDIWVPGKEAANKHLNHLLGKDPRWIRPKDVGEQRQRMDALKNSQRGRKPSDPPRPPSHHQVPRSAGSTETAPQGFHNFDSFDGATLARSSGSSFEKNDIHMHPPPPGPRTTTFAEDTRNNFAPDMPRTGSRTFTGSSHMWTRRRQSTSMTNSTNFSVGSTREGFHRVKSLLQHVTGYAKSDIKDVYRLMKRFTISNDPDSEVMNSTPVAATGTPNGTATNDFANSPFPATPSPMIPTFALPGDPSLRTLSQQGIEADSFGNSLYHWLAGQEGGELQLIQAVHGSDIVSINAANTGGQTCLHVLHDGWFEPGSPLEALVEMLQAKDFNFYATDAYGRSFFHILRLKVPDEERVRNINRHFQHNLLNRRDAFGLRPVLRRQTTAASREEGPAKLSIPSTDKDEERVKEHTRMLKIVTGAEALPSDEDSQGRNALHCLSEVILGMASIRAHANGTPVVKRRMNEKDDSVLQVCSLNQRLQYLETVISARVDVNHYNNRGDTVLMSFISNIIDGQDDKDLEQLIKRLIKAGAYLEARNRNGETVLQVAARLGQKFAVKVLLDQGANHYVRNCQGRSVLQTIDDHYRMEQDTDHLARLDATRAVITGRFSKLPAVLEPQPEQEWGVAVRACISPRLT